MHILSLSCLNMSSRGGGPTHSNFKWLSHITVGARSGILVPRGVEGHPIHLGAHYWENWEGDGCDG